jgi:hypothetical protein
VEKEAIGREGPSMILLRMVGIAQHVLIALDVLWVVDEGDSGVGHDQSLVREYACQDADYFA